MKQQLNATINPSCNEVDIFRAMAKILDSTHYYPNVRSIFVKEVHGAKGYVTFNSSYFTLNNPITREIADLLFVVHHRPTHQIRICFLQAKYLRKGYPFPGFLADIKQWDLLCHRYMLIQSTQNMNFPKDILSFTKYKSITAYGIFFKDCANKIDMLYTIPDFLDPINRRKKLFFSPNFPRCCHHRTSTVRHYPEHIFSCTIDCFIYHLLNGEVGAPIERYPAIVLWLSSVLHRANFIHNEPSSLFDNIFSTLEQWGEKRDATKITFTNKLPFYVFLIETNGI